MEVPELPIGVRSMRKGIKNRTPEARERARELRREMSVSEKVLWSFLRGKKTGFTFRRQYSVGPYTLDFYCPNSSVCVEVDGEQHNERVSQDEARDLWLESNGILTIRIPSLELFDPTTRTLQARLKAVIEACERRAGREGYLP